MVLYPKVQEWAWNGRRGGSRSNCTYHHSQWPTGVFCASHSLNSGLCRVAGPNLQRKDFLARGHSKGAIELQSMATTIFWTPCDQGPGARRVVTGRGNWPQSTDGGRAAFTLGGQGGGRGTQAPPGIPLPHYNWLKRIWLPRVHILVNEALGHTAS